MICWFLDFTLPVGVSVDVSVDELGALRACLRGVRGLKRSAVFTPSRARDPYLDDGASPPLILECYFSDIGALEAALGVAGGLRPLAEGLLPSLAGASVTQQAMLARGYAVPEPEGRAACTYVVRYEGVAEDPNAWLSHYIAHHVPLMTRFPGIRELEVCTRLDWCSALPFPRADCLQRNKVVFDSPAALDAALQSPVRDAMRADFHRFPPFRGRTMHYAMATDVVYP